MLPEIQATLARPPPTVTTMMRGIGLSYVVVIAAYYGVAVAGYAAFGADVSSGAAPGSCVPCWWMRVTGQKVPGW